MPLTFKIEGIDQIVADLSSLPSQMDAGVKINGSANYIKAMVWDLGYVNRVIKPGPKTLWSVNVFGDAKVLTITAPTGFIRVQRDRYLSVLRQEFLDAKFQEAPIAQWPRMIELMMRNVAQICTEIVRNAAPIDTGELRESIEPAFPGDSVLKDAYSTAQPSFDVGSWLE